LWTIVVVVVLATSTPARALALQYSTRAYFDFSPMNVEFERNATQHINRVSFGLLSKLDLQQALETDLNISLARRYTAIHSLVKIFQAATSNSLILTL
jgi:hypothetical protein